MKKTKRVYQKPYVEKIEFDYCSQVVASNGGGNPPLHSQCTADVVFRDGKWEPIGTGTGPYFG